MTDMTKTYIMPSWLKMGTPGACRGQAVEYSYGVDLRAGLMVRRIRDASDRSEKWAIAHLTERECTHFADYDARGEYSAPWVAGRFFDVAINLEE